MDTNGKDRPENLSPSLWQVVKSVASAFFGVQNSANRTRDFKHGKASHFIIIGLTMTVVFVVSLVFLVKLALRLAGV